MNKLTTLVENISLCQERQDWRMCVPPQPDDTDIVLRDCEQTILELCALLDKAEDALEKERVSHITTGHTLGVKCQELYLLLMQAQSALEIISRTTSCNYAGVPEALAAIKQWKEKT